MNWLTIVLLAFIAFLAFRAFRNGFVRELVSLSAVILAIPVAGVFYDDMYPKVHPIVDNVNLAYLISFVAIFAGVIVAGQVISYVLREFVTMLNLGVLDHLAGGLFGFLKAVIVAQVILSIFVLFPSPDLRDSIDSSALATGLLDAAPAVLAILPESFDRGVEAFRAGAAAANDDAPPAEPPAEP